MAVTAKGKALMDAHMSRQSMQRAEDAVKKDYKSFKFTVEGTFYGTKMGDVVKGVSNGVTKTVDAMRDKKKILESVRFFIVARDSSMMLDYNKVGRQYETIKQNIREHFGDAVLVHPNLSHEQSYDMNVQVVGEFSEREPWK